MSVPTAEDLLALAHQKSAEARAELAETVAGLFSEGGFLSDRERALMSEILHQVIMDAEMAVRRSLSEQLAHLPDVPGGLVRMLANDSHEVAYPILMASPVLQDADLVEVIHHRTLEHQLAVASRYFVSEEVSAALVDTGNQSVIEALLSNDNARIADDTMAFLVEESRRVDTFQEPILRREELSPELARRLFLWVGAALRHHIVDRYALDQDTVDELMEQAAYEHIGPSADQTGADAKALAEDLERGKMITPAMLIGALRDGEINLFVSMLERLTKLKRTTIMRILFETGGEGLAIVCKAIGLDREAFASIFRLSRRARPQPTMTRATADAMDRKAMRLFEESPREAAVKVLRRWQRDPDYMTAIRQLEKALPSHG